MNFFFRVTNRLKYLLFFILLVCCFSCTSRTDFLLDKAEELMDRETEQGVAYLNEAKNVGLNDEYQKNLYKLLSVYANYKQWNPIDSVRRMLPLVHYFDENGANKEKALSHYLIAISYYVEKDYAMQYKELCIAKQYVNRVRTWKHVQALIEDHLALLFWSAGLYSEASQHFLQTVNYSQDSGDSVLCGTSLSYHGMCQYRLEKDSNAIDYLRQGYNMVIHAEKERIGIPTVCNLMCEYFGYVQQMDSIEPYAKMALKNSTNVNDSMTSIDFLAVAYCYTHKVDSAIVLFKKLTNSPVASDRARAYMSLADIEKAYKRTEQSLEYERLYNAELNKITWDNHKEIVLKAKQEVDEEWLKEHKARLQRTMAMLAIGVVLTLFLAWWFFSTRWRKKKDSEKNQEKEEIISDVSIEQYIDDSSIMQERVYKKMQEIIHHNREGHSSTIHMDEQDWIELVDFMEKKNRICQKLTEAYDMTTNDLRFCCLVLTGFSRYDMHFILERSESAAYQRERYILQHRFGITDKDKRLKDVLIEMAQGNDFVATRKGTH